MRRGEIGCTLHTIGEKGELWINLHRQWVSSRNTYTYTIGRLRLCRMQLSGLGKGESQLATTLPQELLLLLLLPMMMLNGWTLPPPFDVEGKGVLLSVWGLYWDCGGLAKRVFASAFALVTRFVCCSFQACSFKGRECFLLVRLKIITKQILRVLKSVRSLSGLRSWSKGRMERVVFKDCWGVWSVSLDVKLSSTAANEIRYMQQTM